MLLIGHDDGLSVLNMFPKEWAEEGLTERGPGDAEAHHVWTGEGCAASQHSLFRLTWTLAVFTK